MNRDATYMNKGSIQNRMLRYASGMLGVKDIEMLDPIVRLYVESLSEEVSRISREIENVEERMQEAIAKMIASEVPISSQPAHCLIHVNTTEPVCTIGKDLAFRLANTSRLSSSINKLDFYPSVRTDIYSGDVRYLVHDGLCFEVNSNQDKQLIARSHRSGGTRSRTCWLALSLDVSISNLQNLSFYFDFVESEEVNSLALLPFSHWKMSGKSFKVEAGLYHRKDEHQNEDIALFESFGVTSKLDNDILNYYKKHYLTIADEVLVDDTSRTFPSILSSEFGEQLSHELESNMVWIEVEFPVSMPLDILQTIKVSLNTIPVSNKTLRSKSIELFVEHPIVALETNADESFISVDSIVDSKATSYFELPFSSFKDESYATYSMRTGGYERFNMRDTKEYLLEIAQKIDDSLPVIDEKEDGNDQVKQAVLKVQALVKYLKKKQAEQTQLLEQQNYVLIDKLTSSSDVFFVSYWTSYCALANGIKPNTGLFCVDTMLPIRKDGIFTMTETIGGKYPSFSKDKQKERSKLLETSSVLVSDNDIIAFCKQQFSGLIEAVEIRKGLIKSKENKDLFECTKDVLLIPKQDMKGELTDRDAIIIQQALVANSSASFNYRVRFKVDDHQKIKQ